MIQTVTWYSFGEAFRNSGRKDQFSYMGLRALWEYLEELGSDCGTPMELDVVGLCCDFAEYDNLEEAWNEVAGGEFPGESEALEYFQERTTAIPVDGGGIILGAF